MVRVPDDASLTAIGAGRGGGVSEVSAAPSTLCGMTEDSVDTVIRRAIGGDADAIAWIVAHADSTGETSVLAMAAVLEQQPARLVRARSVAATSRDRQEVEIARAHLAQEGELVDALARDHLVDYPDSLFVAWIASGALTRRPGNRRD